MSVLEVTEARRDTQMAPAPAVATAVVGAGRWGPNLIRVFRDHPASVLRAVVDADTGRLTTVARLVPGVTLVTDLEVVLADDRIEALVVATPGPTHFDVARRALAAGKHVLVEKPLTTSVRDAVDLCELADASGRTLMVGHVFVYNPAVRYIRGLIASGKMGAIRLISSVRANLGPFLDSMNAAWDLACHDVSIANFWLNSGPLAVRATGGSWVRPPNEEVVFTTLRYPDDVLVSVHTSWLSPVKRRETTVVGEHLMVVYDDTSLTEPVRVFHTAPGRPVGEIDETFAGYVPDVNSGDVVIPRIAHEEPLALEAGAFLSAVRTGVRTPSSGRQGLEVVRVLAAVSESLAGEGREVAVDAE